MFKNATEQRTKNEVNFTLSRIKSLLLRIGFSYKFMIRFNSKANSEVPFDSIDKLKI